MKQLKFTSLAVMIIALTFAGGTLLRAAQVDTDGIEAVGRKYGLDDSDTDEIVRAYRGAVNVGIQPKRLESLIGNALSDELEVKYLLRALTLVTNTALNGLPATPMLNKFSEGLAKKVDGRELVEAMENRALSLKKARQILSVLIYEEKPIGELELVIVAAAGALERGVDEDSIEEVFKRESPNIGKIISEIEDLP